MLCPCLVFTPLLSWLVCLVSLTCHHHFEVVLFRARFPITRSSRRHQKGRSSSPPDSLVILFVFALALLSFCTPFLFASFFPIGYCHFISENIRTPVTLCVMRCDVMVAVVVVVHISPVSYRAHGSRPCPLSNSSNSSEGDDGQEHRQQTHSLSWLHTAFCFSLIIVSR